MELLTLKQYLNNTLTTCFIPAKGKSLDATQEMIALGACNIMGSFVRSMPTAGSFTRTAVNNASNVKTTLGGLFTGALVLSALTLTATFKFIPKATLAGLIITAMFYMVEIHEIKLIWKAKSEWYICKRSCDITCGW